MTARRVVPGVGSFLKRLRRTRDRFGLLAHPASVDATGVHSSVLLREKLGDRLTALLGPEHGFYGRGGAGEQIADARHPAWGIPVHSLYGAHRRPTPEMLEAFDTLLFDLQDIGVRCYTFVSTLRLAMEACAEAGKKLVVLDRPLPPVGTVDGVLPAAGFGSFVAGVPMPYVYAMTPGESALFLRRELKLDLDLEVVPVKGWKHGDNWPASLPWISPSPGIRYPATVAAYPITVVFEAFPQIEVGRGSTEPFEVFSAPWFDAPKLADALNARNLGGLRFHPSYRPDPGIRIEVTDVRSVRSFAAAIQVVEAIQRLFGAQKMWGDKAARADWLDKLFATDVVGRKLRAGRPPREILAGADRSLTRFKRSRTACLLYPERP